MRYPNEWEAGRIEGALHIPADELDDRIDEVARDRPVVTVCRSGSRSQEAADRLRAEGVDAQNLDGGLEAWIGAGFALTAEGGRPGRVVEPEAPPVDERMQELQSEFLAVAFAAHERFGDREPSEEEMRAFLHERLVNEGRTPEEADRFLDELGSDDG